MTLDKLHIAVVGPLPPPAGGMGIQTELLVAALRRDGAQVDIVQVNVPIRQRWVAQVPVLRAAFRLVPYCWSLWRTLSGVDLVHVMANSGWSWHLFAAPAIWVATMRGVPVIVNYRGGEAVEFFHRAWRWIRPTLKRASAICVPSPYLQHVFEGYGISAHEVPNILDEQWFPARAQAFHNASIDAPIIAVTRNLEAIYDIGTAISAFQLLHDEIPTAGLIVAGEGPERQALVAQIAVAGLSEAVTLVGRLDRRQIAELMGTATLLLNPSRVDNSPNSVIEALAAGVPVVSTSVGGIPAIVTDGESALLVDPGDADHMAAAMSRVIREPELRRRLIDNGVLRAEKYRWPSVRAALERVYAAAV